MTDEEHRFANKILSGWTSLEIDYANSGTSSLPVTIIKLKVIKKGLMEND